MTKDCISIGNAGGYWGDDPEGLKRQVEGGKLDYITMDFLAEVTMSIMQKQRARNPELGYARDFLGMLEPVLKNIVDPERIFKVYKNKTHYESESLDGLINNMKNRGVEFFDYKASQNKNTKVGTPTKKLIMPEILCEIDDMAGIGSLIKKRLMNVGRLLISCLVL